MKMSFTLAASSQGGTFVRYSEVEVKGPLLAQLSGCPAIHSLITESVFGFPGWLHLVQLRITLDLLLSCFCCLYCLSADVTGLSWFVWCGDQTQGVMLLRQTFYPGSCTARPVYSILCPILPFDQISLPCFVAQARLGQQSFPILTIAGFLVCATSSSMQNRL